MAMLLRSWSKTVSSDEEAISAVILVSKPEKRDQKAERLRVAAPQLLQFARELLDAGGGDGLEVGAHPGQYVARRRKTIAGGVRPGGAQQSRHPPVLSRFVDH